MIVNLVDYLKATRTQGITLDPNGNISFEVYADTNFCGNWHCPTAAPDPIIAKSRTGYSILYSGFPIIWCRKVQTQIALSTTKAEYITLPQSLRDAILMMQLLREIKGNGFHMLSTIP